MTSAGVVVPRRMSSRLALPLVGSDRLQGARGLVPVAELCAGDRLRTLGGGLVTVVAVVRQLAPDPAYGVGGLDESLGADRSIQDVVLPEDQRILIETPGLAALCGSTQALVRMGDLVTAGLGYRVPLEDGPRYHIVLDQPGFLPFQGIVLEPFVPGEAALEALDDEEREAVFAQDNRLRYAQSSAGFAPDLPSLDAREVTIATAGAWTTGADAGKVVQDPQLISMTVPCVPGTSGPQPLQPFSGRSSRPRTTC